MDPILVSGLINIETTLRVDGFPIPYSPVRYPFFGINSSIAGVGFNIAKALTTLGSPVSLLSLVGQDFAGELVIKTLRSSGIRLDGVISSLKTTPQSVIFYDPQGRRQISTDLKDIQERTYPLEIFEDSLKTCSLAALCNINFSRPFLERAVKAGTLVATDVHAVHTLDDEYNRDFMQAAGILFMSDESLPCSPEEWARQIWSRYGTEIVVIGMGSQGALLSVRGDRYQERFPAVQTRPVVSTIGAGDALFSAFVHFYNKDGDPYEAMRRAMVFASYKIGEAGAAGGFLTEEGLDNLFAEESAAG
jgi:acarbose 7IV-phosphotransferase